LPAVDSSTVCQPSFGDLSNSSGLNQSFTPPPCQSTLQLALGDEKTSEPELSYGIPHHLVGETMRVIQQSNKHHLLAVKLLQLLFTKELSTSNCGGNFGKQQLDGIRLELMKRKCHFISSFIFPAVRCVIFFRHGREKECVFCLSSITTTKRTPYRRLFLIVYMRRKL